MNDTAGADGGGVVTIPATAAAARLERIEIDSAAAA